MKVINYNVYLVANWNVEVLLLRLSLSLGMGAMLMSTAATAGDAAVKEVRKARLELNSCYKRQIVRLGKANQETADTLLKAVRSLCDEEDRVLGWAYADTAITTGDMIAFRAKDREEAENDAVAALLVARAEDDH